MGKRRFRRGAWLVGPALLVVVFALQVLVVPVPSARSASPIPDFDATHASRLSITPNLRIPATGAHGDSAIAPPPEVFDAAPEAAVAPPRHLLGEFADVQPEGGTWAVVIGINDYPGTRSDLRSAVTDARDVDEVLGRYGVARSRRLVLTDRQVTADVIRRSTQWLAAHAGPDATAVFFYAGHVRKLGRGSEALVAADGGVVTDRELAELLQPVQARHSWVAIAACYGGGFTEVLTTGRVLTAAADANHPAYENSDFGRSYLVEYMVRRAMIAGAAPRSVESAFAWAKEALRRDYPDRVPFQLDYDAAEIVLGPQSPTAPPYDPAARQGARPAPSPSDTGAPGGSGAGQPAPPPRRADSCSTVTLGVVRCR